jgi:hypothetical protein
LLFLKPVVLFCQSEVKSSGGDNTEFPLYLGSWLPLKNQPPAKGGITATESLSKRR